MYNDDELIGLEDVQEFDLELLHRKRQRHLLDTGQKFDAMTAPKHRLKHECELETEIILESAIIIKPDRDSSPDKETAAAVSCYKTASSCFETKPSPGWKPNPHQDTIDKPDTGKNAGIGPGTEPDYPEPNLPESNLPEPVFRQCRFAILSEKLMDDRRYIALAKSIDDLQYREQLFEEYGIAPTDTTEY